VACSCESGNKHLQYLLPTSSSMFLFVINYCPDVFRPQISAILRDLTSLSACVAYVGEIPQSLCGRDSTKLMWERFHSLFIHRLKSKYPKLDSSTYFK